MTPEQEYLHSQNVYSPVDLSYSQSINTIPSIRDYIISEDLLAGQRLNGRMSNVRRLFCLVVTFDLLLTALMWLMCVMLTGENITTALNEQIVHYNVHTSLFDIVLAALCRFIVLTLFYALLYINHWIVISLSTSFTCAFLIAKVFLFDWPHSSQPVFEVLIVLASFILAWGEAWFLDSRVIPQECHASRYIISGDSERAPLIRSYIQGLPSYTDSVTNFYSPVGTPEGSVHGLQQGPCEGPHPPARFTVEQEDVYKRTAAKTLEDAWDILQQSDWKLEKQVGNDCVYSRVDKKCGKMFKFTTEIDVAPKCLLDELFYRVQDLASWNKAVKESHKVQVIDEYTDITYQISHDAARGLVSCRDFVSLRHWAVIQDGYLMAFTKTEHPSLPATNKPVRGENGIGCYWMSAVPGKSNKCAFSWVLNINLKILLPKKFFEKELVSTMFNFINDLKQHVVNNDRLSDK